MERVEACVSVVATRCAWGLLLTWITYSAAQMALDWLEEQAVSTVTVS